MGQIGKFLRGCTGGHMHYCPGCDEMHVIPSTWSFNGNVDRPTFAPSVLIRGNRLVTEDGRWTGEWRRDAKGDPIPYVCHYFLENAVLIFCADSTHSLADRRIALPGLPAWATDPTLPL